MPHVLLSMFKRFTAPATRLSKCSGAGLQLCAAVALLMFTSLHLLVQSVTSWAQNCETHQPQ